jgi:rubredoxin
MTTGEVECASCGHVWKPDTGNEFGGGGLSF